MTVDTITVLNGLLAGWNATLDANGWGNLALSPAEYARIKRQAEALTKAVAVLEKACECKDALEWAEQYTGNAALVAGSEKACAEFQGYNAPLADLLALLKED